MAAMHHRPAVPSATSTEIPPHPQTLDGPAVLHQMFRVQRPAWQAMASSEREEILAETAECLAGMERRYPAGTGLFSMLGHKGDLMAVHFRPDLEQVHLAELELAALRISHLLEPTTSYVSVVELGLYDSSFKLYGELREAGIPTYSPAWNDMVRRRLEGQAAAMAPRLAAEMPPHKYLCFYPMDKKRGEAINWYTRPIKERLQMMREHGLIGRRFAGRVKQVISGSIGFDDWEWGVDLFADNPLVFKQLIYEMRFDEASAAYAAFGPFYISLRLAPAQLGPWLDGKGPAFGLSPQD